MKHFDELYTMAVARHGEDALLARLSKPATAAKLRQIPDDRYLAMMTKRVFQSGFVWRVIESKWDNFEAAFHGFDPGILSVLPDEEYEAQMQNAGIVRNWQKIRTIPENACFVSEIADEHGGFGAWLAGWDSSDIVGLWQTLKKRGSRLGGNTGQYFLRFAGKDTFILSRDVTRSLMDQKIVDRTPTSQRDQRAAQDAFNTWQEQSGRPLCEISMIVACTVDA